MCGSEIFSNYGLIGDNLELKKDVALQIDENGKIESISYNDIDNKIFLSNNKKNSLLIPGLINSHIHIGDSFAKEQGYNKPLKEIVAPPNGLKHLLLNQTPKKIIIKGIRNAVLELLSNGITFFIDFREGGLQGLNILHDAIEKEPLINYLALGRFFKIDEIEKVFDLADGIGLSNYERVSSSEIKQSLRKCKEKSGKIIACHIAESSRNNELINQIFNDNIVDIFIHGTHFIKSDLHFLKKNHKPLVLCPRCNGYFGVGTPPVDEILNYKIHITLGTDNLMINSPDLFEELRYLYRILRLRTDKVTLSGRELLKMITIDAAKIFSLEHYTGSISERKNGDFFLINLNDPNYYTSMLDIESIYALIVGRTTPFNIKKTYVRGKLVHEKK